MCVRERIVVCEYGWVCGCIDRVDCYGWVDMCRCTGEGERGCVYDWV